MLATTKPPEQQLPPPTEGRWYIIGRWTRNHRLTWLACWWYRDPDVPPSDEEVRMRLAETDRGPHLESLRLVFATDHGEAQRVYQRRYSGRAAVAVQQISASGCDAGAA